VTDGVTIEVGRGSVFPSNFVLALLLILVPFFFFLWRHIRFESARQGESDSGGVSSMFDQSDDEEEE
jgi:hypothetical protein